MAEECPVYLPDPEPKPKADVKKPEKEKPSLGKSSILEQFVSFSSKPASVMQKLPGQVEAFRLCPADGKHKTECFAAKSGVLWWRCTNCIEDTGAFAGKPKLIGRDGDQWAAPANNSKRPALESTSGNYAAGKTYSLKDIMDSLAVIQSRQNETLERLQKLEKRFTEEQELIPMFDQ